VATVSKNDPDVTLSCKRCHGRILGLLQFTGSCNTFQPSLFSVP